jgi:hypothetical protein
MNRWFPLLFLCLAIPAYADDAPPVAQDDASNASYGGGWSDGGNGGAGFNPWGFETHTGSGNSFAGFYIASNSDHPDVKIAPATGKAFALYANGTDFESAAAFRAFTVPVAAGQSVVLSWETGQYERKFDTDSPLQGSVGVTLRTGTSWSSADDYNNGSRFEFGVYQGVANYQVYDGQDDHDTGVPFSEGGVKLKFTLVSPDTYNLDITTLADQKTKTLTGRKLAGGAGGAIDSLCIFDRNWEKNDAYFAGLEVLPASASPSASPSATPAASATPTPPIPGVTPAGL